MKIRLSYLYIASFLAIILASGCGSNPSSLVLGAMGIKKDPAFAPQKNISFQVHAAENLNADDRGNGLSVVLRMYKLKDVTAFNEAQLDAMGDSASVQKLLGADLIESKEQLLLPGQRYQFKEKIDAKNGFIAIAVLFRNPNLKRWKLVMENADLKEDTPVIIGAHACAINVSSGIPDRGDLDSKFLVSIAPCKK